MGDTPSPHTLQPGITRLPAFPCALLARKWGSLSLRSDCDYVPRFPDTLNTQSADLSPRTQAAKGAHACWDWLGFSHQPQRGDGGGGP